MTNVPYRPQFTPEGESGAPAANWLVRVSILTLVGLFVGAVFSAGVTMQASYQLSQIDQQKQTLVYQKQLLQEKLAEATSLGEVQAFALQSGFDTPIRYAAAVTVTTPVAQR